jgi:hypothetical protein
MASNHRQRNRRRREGMESIHLVSKNYNDYHSS